MNVYVLIREDQNDHGFVDTSVEAVFTLESDAVAAMNREEQEARDEGSRVWGDEGDWDESDWEVSWMVRSTELR